MAVAQQMVGARALGSLDFEADGVGVERVPALRREQHVDLPWAKARKLGRRAPAAFCFVQRKNPGRISDPGFRSGPSGTSGDVPGPRHMCSIITWPKPEHDTCVAPGSSRAKS